MPPNQTIGLIVNDVARLYRRRFEQIARLRRLGLTRAQAAVLIHLVRNEGGNQVTLAQSMDLEPITLVRLLDRLQAAGFVERRAAPLDRRARSLFLTPAAHAMLTRIDALGQEVQDEAMARLPAADCDVFIDILVAMKGNLLEQLADHAEDAIDFAPEPALNG
jgi:DNA-binding MarR family transcriptional regulator